MSYNDFAVNFKRFIQRVLPPEQLNRLDQSDQMRQLEHLADWIPCKPINKEGHFSIGSNLIYTVRHNLGISPDTLEAAFNDFTAKLEAVNKYYSETKKYFSLKDDIEFESDLENWNKQMSSTKINRASFLRMIKKELPEKANELKSLCDELKNKWLQRDLLNIEKLQDNHDKFVKKIHAAINYGLEDAQNAEHQKVLKNQETIHQHQVSIQNAFKQASHAQATYRERLRLYQQSLASLNLPISEHRSTQEMHLQNQLHLQIAEQQKDEKWHVYHHLNEAHLFLKDPKDVYNDNLSDFAKNLARAIREHSEEFLNPLLEIRSSIEAARENFRAEREACARSLLIEYLKKPISEDIIERLSKMKKGFVKGAKKLLRIDSETPNS